MDESWKEVWERDRMAIGTILAYAVAAVLIWKGHGYLGAGLAGVAIIINEWF